MQDTYLPIIYLFIGITTFGLLIFFVFKQRNEVQGHSTFEEKYEQLFKYAFLDKKINEVSLEDVNRYATLIFLSMNLDKASKKEKQAFNKVYKQYKSTVEQAIEKEKWFKAFSEARDNLERIQYSWKGTAEEHQVLKQYNKLYGKISKNIK